MADLAVAVEINAQDHLSAAADHGTRALESLDRAAGQSGGALRSLSDIAEGAAGGIGHLAGRIATLTTVVTIAHTLEDAFRGFFGTITNGVVGMNANLETATLQFTTLMGSADLAKEHVASLFEIGKESPFETAPIIEASRLLETFGGAALNTRENIIRFGDAAAGTNNKIEEVSFWVGRMYAALQGGRPFGESIQRLQEMAIISPKVSAALSDISEKGGDGAEAWRVLTTDLDRFNGAQSALAATWQGLTSTFSDTLNQLIAGAGRPFFEAMKSGLSDLNTLLGSDAAAQFSADLAARFTEVLGNLGTMKDEFLARVADIKGAEGLDGWNAALKATADIIGEQFGKRAKEDFERTTAAVGTLSEALGGLAAATPKIVAAAGAWGRALDDFDAKLRNVIHAVQTLNGIKITPAEAGALQGGELSPEETQKALEAGRYVIVDGKFVPKDVVDARVAEASANTDAYLRSIGLIQDKVDAATGGGGGGKPKPPPRDTTIPPFPVAGRGAATGGGAGRAGASAREAETAIQGFMEALRGGEADATAEFGQLGGRLATALNTAIATNSKSGGAAVAKALEDMVDALRIAGVEDWRDLGDELAAGLHDALIDGTPAAVAAAGNLIAQMSQRVDTAQFWSAWARAGEESATRVNVATQNTAEKIEAAYKSAKDRVQAIWDSLNLTKQIEAARAAIDGILQRTRSAQEEGTRQIQAQRSARDTATDRLRQDADRQAALDQRIADIRKRGGPTAGADVRQAQADFDRETATLRLRREREDTDNRQRTADQAADRTREEGNRQNLESGRTTLETAYGITTEQLRQLDATRQIAAIWSTTRTDIENLNNTLGDLLTKETAALTAVLEALQKKYPNVFPGEAAPAGEPVLPEFQHGGTIPGPAGAPQHVLAHGGELVLTADQAMRLQSGILGLGLGDTQTIASPGFPDITPTPTIIPRGTEGPTPLPQHWSVGTDAPPAREPLTMQDVERTFTGGPPTSDFQRTFIESFQQMFGAPPTWDDILAAWYGQQPGTRSDRESAPGLTVPGHPHGNAVTRELIGESLPSFAGGGFVPGAFGSPRMIMAHGGEMLLSPESSGARRELYITNYGIMADMPTFSRLTLDAEQRLQQQAVATQGA
jgi:hypothetical protein